MGSLSTGGGSGAVAASAHAGCERHRHTDPLVTGMSRRKLGAHLGQPDTSAGIPEARWMRAMTFERLVRDTRFVSELLTTAVGALGLDRPAAVHRADGQVSTDTTARVLAKAHDRALADDEATMVTGLAVPFVGMEGVNATPVKPDFAIVAPRHEGPDEGGRRRVVGSWLIMGDAKDFERVRSRIDDQRMLKGFLQVALGAISAETWSKLPSGMLVHDYGALAVPRNAFLQPEAVVERLVDHRAEVLARADEREQLLSQLGPGPLDPAALAAFVSHREARFDPRSCAACSLFNHCRAELRNSHDAHDLLVEIGIAPEHRPMVTSLLNGEPAAETAPASMVANVLATLTGLPQWTGQRRIDPVGLPGTANLVLAKSDSAALGVYGMGLQRVTSDGSRGPWTYRVFDDPQSPATRLAVMEAVGEILGQCLAEPGPGGTDPTGPVHLVVPDRPTMDVLVSIADSVAGVEISRLRWQRDLDMGRDPLTPGGEPAVVPPPLTGAQRLAVSFLLDEDRRRALRLRCPIVDARSVLARHLVAGGPTSDGGRLDYLVRWAEAATPLDHRQVSDEIADSPHTPGARLANATSDSIHQAYMGSRRARGKKRPAEPALYRDIISQELAYKADVLERAVIVLEGLTDSRLRQAFRALEGSAQGTWRRRNDLRAFDLVRFGRTSPIWRNAQVPVLDADISCARQLDALTSHQVAYDMAVDAGIREVARAEVLGTAPVRLLVKSRRMGDGIAVVILHLNGEPCAEDPTTTVKIQKGDLKLGGLTHGPLEEDGLTARDRGLTWTPSRPLTLSVGDELVVAALSWFDVVGTPGDLKVSRPAQDKKNAPGEGCGPTSFAEDPEGHRWCCRPHESQEADTADWLADQRSRGLLNPQAWPPVIDEDQFDATGRETPTAATVSSSDLPDVPEHLTIDDLD